MFTDEQKKELNKKLDPKHVQPPKSFGPKGDYLEGWFVIEEANRIFGHDGWSYQVIRFECVFQGERAIGKNKEPGWGVTYTTHVRVTVGDVIREDTGAGHGYDRDCGLAHESAIKEAVTDALKRALRTFGNPFGLALYDKSRANVGVDIDWASERDDLTRMVNECKSFDDLLELWQTERMKAFVNRAPQEFSSPVIRIKDKRKTDLAPRMEAAE